MLRVEYRLHKQHLIIRKCMVCFDTVTILMQNPQSQRPNPLQGSTQPPRDKFIRSTALRFNNLLWRV